MLTYTSMALPNSPLLAYTRPTLSKPLETASNISLKTKHKAKFPKISYINVSDKMTFANDFYKQCRPRWDCPWRSSLIRVYTVCHSTRYLKKKKKKKKKKKNSIKSKILAKKCMEQSVGNFRTLSVWTKLSYCGYRGDGFEILLPFQKTVQ